MVTKLAKDTPNKGKGSVLAKIFMVTKLDVLHDLEWWQFCSSKNPYGNKTVG